MIAAQNERDRLQPLGQFGQVAGLDLVRGDIVEILAEQLDRVNERFEELDHLAVLP
jgi:hypothetical protein